jgi:hypothetical protein
MAEPTTRTPTHYDILGVRPTASPQQIRRAFRDLSKLYHPDTTELPAAEATEKFQQLNEAYAVLSSPDRRWTYDKQVGYSRISVMQPLEPLSRSQPGARKKQVSNLYLDPNDRPLSAGEIFALFILGLTFVACLVLVLTIGVTRGEVVLNPLDDFSTESAEVGLSSPQTSPQTAALEQNTPGRQSPGHQYGQDVDNPQFAPVLPKAPLSDLEQPSARNSQAEPEPQPPVKPAVEPPGQPTWL